MISINKRLVTINCFLLMFFLFAIKVSAAPNIERFGGKDRYETSIKVCESNWTQSENVILVSGENFPDALSASPLAKKYNAPILLVKKESIGNDILKELERLQTKNVFIIGGNGAISESVENELKNLNIKITRIYGQDRYETSIKVAEFIGVKNGAFIASGENFPDAVSVSSIAALKQMPIILTTSNNMPKSVKDFINNNIDTKYYVAGGQASVNNNIVGNIKNLKRLSGKDRYETNSAIVNEFLDSINFDNVYLASGEGFADALAGSSSAVKSSSPIILVSNYFDVRNNMVKNNIGTISKIKILGGTGAISDTLVNKVIKGQYIKVCLDAGHGGYDPGAIGVSGLQEKDVNLSIALKVGNILEKNSIGVVYTRTSDNVSWSSNKVDSLQTRCDIASKENVQYFISIHNNSSLSSSISGTETYYINGSVTGQNLAETIQNELVKNIGLENRGIQTANFYVLRNTDMPAALVEVAFLSNKYDESLLKSEAFQNKIAQGIANGIIKFIN